MYISFPTFVAFQTFSIYLPTYFKKKIDLKNALHECLFQTKFLQLQGAAGPSEPQLSPISALVKVHIHIFPPNPSSFFEILTSFSDDLI